MNPLLRLIRLVPWLLSLQMDQQLQMDLADPWHHQRQSHPEHLADPWRQWRQWRLIPSDPADLLGLSRQSNLLVPSLPCPPCCP